jgi:hypothetical protein
MAPMRRLPWHTPALGVAIGCFSLLALVIAGCTEGKAKRAQCVPSAPGAGDGIYVMAGAEASSADLYTLRLPLTFHRLTTDARISSLGANSDMVVVSSARLDVDRLESWNGCELVPVSGLGSPHAYTPALSRERKLAYIELGDSSGALSFTLKTWDIDAQRAVEILSSKSPLANPCWGDGNVLRVLENPGNQPNILTVDTAGRVSREPAGVDDGLVMRCSRDVVAISPSRTRARTLLIDLPTGRRRVIAGWSALAWSPDGTRLLMTTVEGRLGILNWPGTNPPEDLGLSPIGPLWDAAWAR